MGGGSLLYIKENLSAELVGCQERSEFQKSIWCIVKMKQEQLYIGFCYMSPSSGTENNKKLLES
jgi:hypothetical protein